VHSYRRFKKINFFGENQLSYPKERDSKRAGFGNKEIGKVGTKVGFKFLSLPIKESKFLTVFWKPKLE